MKKRTNKKMAHLNLENKLTKVDGFTKFKNPKEEAYEFNVQWLHTSKKAVVHWIPKNESGVT